MVDARDREPPGGEILKKLSSRWATGCVFMNSEKARRKYLNLEVVNVKRIPTHSQWKNERNIKKGNAAEKRKTFAFPFFSQVENQM